MYSFTSCRHSLLLTLLPFAQPALPEPVIFDAVNILSFTSHRACRAHHLPFLKVSPPLPERTCMFSMNSWYIAPQANKCLQSITTCMHPPHPEHCPQHYLNRVNTRSTSTMEHSLVIRLGRAYSLRLMRDKGQACRLYYRRYEQAYGHSLTLPSQ